MNCGIGLRLTPSAHAHVRYIFWQLYIRMVCITVVRGKRHIYVLIINLPRNVRNLILYIISAKVKNCRKYENKRFFNNKGHEILSPYAMYVN